MRWPRVPILALLTATLVVGGVPGEAQVLQAPGAPVARLDPARATADQLGLALQAEIKAGDYAQPGPTALPDQVERWVAANKSIMDLTNELEAEWAAEDAAPEAAPEGARQAEAAAELRSQRIVVQTAKTVTAWAGVKLETEGDVTLNDPLDSANAKLEDITREQAELEQAYRDADSPRERGRIRQEMQAKRVELTRAIEGIGKLTAAISVPVQSSYRIDKNVTGELRDCPSRTAAAVRQFYIARRKLAECQKGPGSCPGPNREYDEAVEVYDAVNNYCEDIRDGWRPEIEDVLNRKIAAAKEKSETPPQMPTPP